MRIAVASSGLGHVARGIETWALDTAHALKQRGVDVVLFAGGPDVPNATYVSCWQRYQPVAQRLAKWTPPFLWRWGLKSAYGWEQLSFWLGLQKQLRAGAFDVLHVQDPMLAYWCNVCRRRGWIRTCEILAHGTEEPVLFRSRFDFVQELAPWHLTQARQQLGPPGESATRYWVAIPNFVDTDVFRPSEGLEEQHECRRRMGIPESAFVIGCVAAVKRDHKRIDYLLREFASYLAASGETNTVLLIAGSRQPDTGDLRALAETLAPGRVIFKCDAGRVDMPALYRSMDLFVLPSLFEMMPIAVLEAMASGLPLITHEHPVLKWMMGHDDRPAGFCSDISGEGNLAALFGAVADPWRLECGQAARDRACSEFAVSVVVERYLAYYLAATRETLNQGDTYGIGIDA